MRRGSWPDDPDSNRWLDPARPPVDATDLSGGVWFSWMTEPGAADRLLTWHWCTESKWIAEGRPHAKPQWAACFVPAHNLISVDPLHLEPSIYWPDCCGKHGFIRDGRWSDA